MTDGSATIEIDRPIGEVFDAITDVTRMGEWSPECVAARWVAPATGPEVGAEFEGDNVAKLGPITLKHWTTTSKVTEWVPNEVFEFVAEGYTTWRYEFADVDGSTTVTESFSHDDYTGFVGFVYGTVMRRQSAMVKGMERTLERVKAQLEAA
jgi:uncharacterized protein YndB with AHSA1/START domain